MVLELGLGLGLCEIHGWILDRICQRYPVPSNFIGQTLIYTHPIFCFC